MIPLAKDESRSLGRPTAGAPHPPLSDFYGRPEGRVAYVRGLFDRTAGQYNRISAMLSFGSDRKYRRQALRRAGLEPGMKLLDVASGTGLAAQAALDLGLPGSDVVGLDLSWGMLVENRRARPIPLCQGMAERLPFRSSTFDCVSMGYALRHVEDLAVLFGELGRILKPAGRVLLLEITRPESRVGLAALRFYMKRLVPWITDYRTRSSKAAGLLEYYWATIEECVSPGEILEALGEAGFREVNRHAVAGLLSEYSAVKP
jgi:demethylmenaquinone methyltransferase/2-methoxy-6-polyprenyl-1,4-benzoquinol methylase